MFQKGFPATASETASANASAKSSSNDGGDVYGEMVSSESSSIRQPIPGKGQRRRQDMKLVFEAQR